MPARPTKATDELISLAEDLLARRFSKGDVKRLLTARYVKDNPKGRISPRTLEVVISAARANILGGTGRDREEHRAESLALYQSVIRSPGVAPKDRIRAQECVDRLLGLSAPLKHEVAGTVTHAPADLSKLSDDELATYRAMLAKMTPVAQP